MNFHRFKVLLADDDADDCIFFKEALDELPLFTKLTTVHDGEKLMKYLDENSTNLPDVLFLDLSMPRKDGFECLAEIKQSEKLKDLPVIIFSISYPQSMGYEPDKVNMFFKMGVHHYIRKQSNLAQLRLSIHDAIKKVIEMKAPVTNEDKL